MIYITDSHVTRICDFLLQKKNKKLICPLMGTELTKTKKRKRQVLGRSKTLRKKTIIKVISTGSAHVITIKI